MSKSKTLAFAMLMIGAMAMLGSACVIRATPGVSVVGTSYYTPQYYNGYVVYYNNGIPFYYLNGQTIYVPSTYSYYNSYVNHYRRYRPYYSRWYRSHGYRYRTWRQRRYRSAMRATAAGRRQWPVPVSRPEPFYQLHGQP